MTLYISGVPEHLILTNIPQLEPYSRDKAVHVVGMPSCVILPETDAHVQAALRYAEDQHMPVTCRGAGTGTTGASVATRGGMVISFERMTAIKELDTVNSLVVLEPGVITGDLKKVVAQEGLYYPPDPASFDTCTIGGNVACNSGGPCGLKYGVTGDYVLGLRGFYVDGTQFSFGGKQLKNVAGYDLLRLLIGSEGNLGVITDITLRLIPLPQAECSFLIGFEEARQALDGLVAIREAGVLPCAAEYVDDRCIDAVFQYMTDLNLPVREDIWFHASKKGYLLIRCDGRSEESVQADIQQVVQVLSQQSGVETFVPSDKTEEDALWQVRRSVSTALRYNSPGKVSQDIVVPPSEVPEYMQFLTKLGDQYDLCILGYGHLGDGNIHVNILVEDEARFSACKDAVLISIFTEAIRRGGSLTGEHGIGQTKQAYLGLMYDERTLGIFQKIKSVFDPDNRLGAIQQSEI